jgi:hypothetical protein
MLISSGALLVVVALFAAGCGGGRVFSTGGGGSGGVSGAGDAGEMPDGNGGVPSISDACEADSQRCQGDTPQLCIEGAWQNGGPCGTGTRCTGAGVCAAFRLLDGGIRSLSSATTVGPLKSHTLSSAPRACAGTYCVSGGIQ